MSVKSVSCPDVYSSSFQVSSKERPPAIQHLIDESFTVRVLPLHQEMFNGRCCNYLCWGQFKDYTFQDSERSIAGTTALKIAQEFASKERFAVLDLGCGVGTFMQSLKERFTNVDVIGVTAADFRPTIYNSEELKIPDEEYVVANLENLDRIPALHGRKFDLIVAAVTIRHLSDPLRLLCRAYDLLNKNGILIVDDFHLNGITGQEYLEMFKEAGCDEVEIQPAARMVKDEKGNYRIQRNSSSDQESSYIMLSDDHPDQTKIRKTALEHLCLPIYYDLAKSTRASDLEQTHIFYTRDVERIG